MAKKFDLESFLDGIATIYQANLSAKLLEIAAEKADGMVLKPVANEAYFFQNLGGKSMNYNPCILVGLQDIQSEGRGPHTLQSMVVNVVLILADEGEDVNVGRRMLRYSRALREVLEANWSDPSILKSEVSSLVPIDFKLLESDQLYRAVGIEIKAAIG